MTLGRDFVVLPGKQVLEAGEEIEWVKASKVTSYPWLRYSSAAWRVSRYSALLAALTIVLPPDSWPHQQLCAGTALGREVWPARFVRDSGFAGLRYDSSCAKDVGHLSVISVDQPLQRVEDSVWGYWQALDIHRCRVKEVRYGHSYLPSVRGAKVPLALRGVLNLLRPCLHSGLPASLLRDGWAIHDHFQG